MTESSKGLIFNNPSLLSVMVISIYLCRNDSMMIQLQVEVEERCLVDSFVYLPRKQNIN